MEYKGYVGTVAAVDEKQGVLCGRVTNIADVITFEGKTLDELVQAFHDSIDDYLEWCQEDEEEPERPYSGRFLVRIAPRLHARAVRAAKKEGISLNSWISDAITSFLSPRKRRVVMAANPRAIKGTRKTTSKKKRSGGTTAPE